jgi:DNA-binding GntR family transcriptional regulator
MRTHTSTHPASRDICHAVEDDIVTGRLAPGAKLDEAGLSERFDVSRTPVREALRVLAERGLVELIRNRGAFVAEVSVPRLIEMFEVMAELEATAGRLCARRMTAGQQAALLSRHKACCTASRKKNPDDYYYRNEEFHDAIVAGSNNTFLTEQASALRRRLQPYRRMQLRVPRRIHDSRNEHQAIVDAIIAGEESEAERLLRDHVLIQGERFTDFMAMFAGNRLGAAS